jgi:pimeloyl-ACP methyl ester carboxylesterase
MTAFALPGAEAAPTPELALHRAAGAHDECCLLALPPRVHADTPLLVSVHGVTRQPLEHALAFAPLAQARGAALVVPFFDQRAHRRYQQLAHPRTGRRSDLALLDMVDALRARHGLRERRLHLFGFSGGGQFAHRFALAHPERVAALGVGAAGWYTMPDPTTPYPAGLRGAEFVFGRTLDLQAFLRLPMRVWVGARDDGADRNLRIDAQICAAQGASRIERAQRWVQSVRDAAAQRAIDCDAGCELLSGAGHSFVQCVRRGKLARKVVSFFFDRCG